MANDAGVPIIVDNGDIGDKDYTAFVGCTDQESGELLGKWFMEESGLEKGSKVAIIEGPDGTVRTGWAYGRIRRSRNA